MEIIQGGLKYNYDYTGAYVCANDYKGDIVIPAYIQDSCSRSIPVIGIDARAFYKSEIISISLPEGLQEIGAYCFAMCNQLTEIRIPNTVVKIDEYAFCCCDNLLRVVLPKQLLHLPNGCCAACTKLDDIQFPDSLRSVGECALHATAWIKRQQGGVAYVNDILYGYVWSNFEDSVLYVKDGTNVIGDEAFMGAKNLTEVILPASVKVVGNRAFEECKNLKTIHLPEGLCVIGENAFADCSALVSIHIPSTVKHINAGAFAKCTHISEIVVDENNPYYDSRDNCNAIIKTHANRLVVGCANTVIPDNIVVIGDLAFNGVWLKEELVIPQSVKCIGGKAFMENDKLCSVVLHDNVEMIGEYAFASCTALMDVVLPSQYIDIGEQAFCDTDCLDYHPNGAVYIGNHLHIYNTPENVDSIPDCVIPEGIEYIDDWAFDFAHNGLRIFLPRSLKTISDIAFIPFEAEYEIIVPEGVGEDYPFRNGHVVRNNTPQHTMDWVMMLNEDWGWDEADKLNL